MPSEFPSRFPSEERSFLERAAAERARAPEERLLAALEVSDFVRAIRAESPVRARQDEILDEEEAREHRRWKALFETHG